MSPEESYVDAHRVATKQVDALLDAWNRRPMGVETADGHIMIRPCDYEGLVKANGVVTLLTRHGRFEVTATAECVSRIFTPPRVRPLLGDIRGWDGARANGIIGWRPGTWVDPGDEQ